MVGSFILRNIRRCTPIVAAATLVVALFGVHTGAGPVVRAAGQPAAHVQSAYGKLPLSFIANAGQSDSSVHFQVRGSDGTLSFENGGVTLDLTSLTPGPSL